MMGRLRLNCAANAEGRVETSRDVSRRVERGLIRVKCSPVLSSALDAFQEKPVNKEEMAKRHHVQGYESFLKFMEELKVDGDAVYVLYTGTKLPSGQSWCPDCVEAEPFIDKAFDSLSKDTHLVVNEVGERAFWKDPNCPFRTNAKTKLKVLPTLAKWGTQKRLEGEHCQRAELLDMLLNDEED